MSDTEQRKHDYPEFRPVPAVVEWMRAAIRDANRAEAILSAGGRCLIRINHETMRTLSEACGIADGNVVNGMVFRVLGVECEFCPDLISPFALVRKTPPLSESTMAAFVRGRS